MGLKDLVLSPRTRALLLHALMLKTFRQSGFHMYIMNALFSVGQISRKSSTMKKDFLKSNTLVISEVS